MAAPFSVTYAGPLLDDGLIDVADLAPSLIALSEIFKEMHSLEHPGQTPVTLRIKATEHGSFTVDLEIYQALIEQLVDMFNNDRASAAANLVTLVTGGVTGAVGLFSFIRWLRGRAVRDTKQLDPGSVEITTVDGDSIVIPASVARAAGTISVRKQVEQVVKPLHRSGIARLIFKDTETTTSTTTEWAISSDEVGYFDSPESSAEVLSEAEEEWHLSIVAPNFRGDKWRMSEGDGSSFFVAIEDEAFLDRVDAGESFRKGDILKVRMAIVQSSSLDGSLATERTVTEVLEHKPRDEQRRLF